MMKKFLLAIIASAMTLGANAQVNGDGYYRVTNLGFKVLKKKNVYVFVDHDKAIITSSAGTGQSFEAIALYEDVNRSPISDPASIIYAKINGNNVDLEGQGTSVSKMTDAKLTLTQNGKANSYQLSAIKSGMTLYLWTAEMQRSKHAYTTTITNNGGVAYKFWAIYPVSVTSDNYFGVKPTLNANGKHYAPFFASFPFKFASTGMKAYYVKSYDTEHFALEEITSEVKPGNTPMLIECSSEDPSNNRLDLLHGNYGVVSGNKLSGVYFCNDFQGGFDNARVTFDAKTMRVWNVENGQLVLSTATNNLHTSYYYGRLDGQLQHGYLNANQSYLKVSSNVNATLTIGSTGVNGVKSADDSAEPVSYTTVGGVKINAPKAGMGVVIVKYSDGSARRVVY